MGSYDKCAAVEIRVTHERKCVYVSTGIKLYAGQWKREQVVNRIDIIDLNKRITEIKARIDDYINKLIRREEEFSLDKFKAWMDGEQGKKICFLEWLEERIVSRQDIRDSSRKNQMKLVGKLEEFGKIKNWEHLTQRNIKAFDDFLHSQELKQSTVWGYHKALKTYINEALKCELTDKNPYLGFKIDRGKTEWGKFLTVEELERLESATLPAVSLEKVRDMFIVQCYTGLAFSDLMNADFTKTKEVDGMTMLAGSRKKTDTDFSVVISPKVKNILARHGGNLPKMSNEQYNLRLKIIAQAAGIDKPLSSHWGRRTCGMLLLNEGYPIEVVAKVLGHTDIKTTQTAYAKILDETVVREFAKRMSEEKEG